MRKTPYARDKFHFDRGELASTKRDAEQRLREVPADTRDLTARICGDPLPGRSALAKRQNRG
jgi:hypothetical protein